MQILIDYNLEGDADLLIATLQQDGWTDLLLLEFIHLRDTPLGPEAKDNDIWHYVQTQGMILLTNNRNRDDDTSLQATMERENTSDSLPLLTIANPLRLKESSYRQAVAERLAEILAYLENHLGTGRLYLP
jgi:predicted nuclease of predicted toxin-antitoxin system